MNEKLEIKPGTRFTMTYEVVRPVVHNEPWTDAKGKVSFVDNKRGELFVVKLVDVPTAKERLFCANNYLPEGWIISNPEQP